MKTTTIQCGWCKSYVEKPSKEINRQRRQGRSVFYCDLTCGANDHNRKNPHLAEVGRQQFIKMNLVNNRSPTFMRNAIYSKEAWKYHEIECMLAYQNIPYIFEFPILHSSGMYLYDLCLPTYDIIVEFDGQHHCGTHSEYDRIKDAHARLHGYEVLRIPVRQSEVYPFETLEAILGPTYLIMP